MNDFIELTYVSKGYNSQHHKIVVRRDQIVIVKTWDESPHQAEIVLKNGHVVHTVESYDQVMKLMRARRA